MRSMLAILALAATVTLGVPAAAPALTTIDVAAAQWPWSPCRGREQVVWETRASANQVPGMDVAMGWWDYGTCTVHVIAHDDLPKLCTTLQHEFGHAAGLVHTDDPEDVMSTERRGPSAACRRAFPTWVRYVWRCRRMNSRVEVCGYEPDRVAYRCWPGRARDELVCDEISYSAWRRKIRQARASRARAGRARRRAARGSPAARRGARRDRR